jgi:hypothetical protein
MTRGAALGLAIAVTLGVALGALSNCHESPWSDATAAPASELLATMRTDPLDEPHDAGACTARLFVGAVTPSPGCWVDEKVGKRTGTLAYLCGGGAASTQLGVEFSGTVSATGQVDVAATTTFAWSDGCKWQSEQRITGRLSSGSLTYGYREAPIEGTHCQPAHCTASAKVSVDKQSK